MPTIPNAWASTPFELPLCGPPTIVPLPTPLLDVLITLNLAVSVAVLLTAVYSQRTLELSTFPTLLVAYGVLLVIAGTVLVAVSRRRAHARR